MSLEAPEHTRSIDYTTPTEGLGFIDEIVGAADDIRNGDIVSLVQSAQGLYDEIGGLVADPVGYIGGMVVEWIMQHVEPLKGWINQLTGDSGQVYGMSASWDSISSSLASIASELDSGSYSAMSSMRGEAVRAYLERQAIVVSAINAISDASSAFGAALSKVADSVDNIHDAVVGAISDIIVTCFEVVAEVVLSLGTAAPVAAEQVASKVAKWVGRIEPIMEMLTYALEALQAIFAVLTSAGSDLTRGVEKIGEQCQAPGGGCCGEGGMRPRTPGLPGDGNWNTDGPYSNGATSGGSNNVGGDNNGINAGGDVNIDNSQHDDRHIEVNPTIEVGGGDGGSSDKGGDHDSGHDGHENGKGGGHDGNRNGNHDGNRNGNHDGNRSGNHDGNRSGNRSGNHDGNRSGNRSGNHDGNHDGNRSGNRSGNHDGNRSGNRSGNHDGNRSGNHDGNRSGNHDGNRSGNRSGNHDGGGSHHHHRHRHH